MESNVGGARNLFNFVRHFCLFDTSGITDTHTVSAATLKVYGIGTIDLSTSGATEMSPSTSVLVQTSPASNTALVITEFFLSYKLNELLGAFNIIFSLTLSENSANN